MISQETVFEKIWPVVEGLIEATLAEDDAGVRRRLAPGQQAAIIHDLFGFAVFDILLKTVLGREHLGLTRAIETDEGRFVYVEYAWPDPASEDNSYTAADVVSVKLKRYRKRWRVVEINPAVADLPLTEPRAQGILTSSKILTDEAGLPREPWILPVALLAGTLQIPLSDRAAADPVEELLLPGLQHRAYGILSLVSARTLWRDFKKKARPELEEPAAWAAAVEFVMNEQSARNQTQAAVAKTYQVNLTALLSRVKQLKQTLNIQGLDERYSALQRTQIVFKE